MARGIAAPKDTVRLRHPEARSCFFGGRVYTADGEGVICVPVEAAAALAAHGFRPAEE